MCLKFCFCFFSWYSIGITSSIAGLKTCAIIAGIKKYKSKNKKTKKEHYKIVLLVKTKSNSIEVLISRALNNLYISHDEFISVNNVIRKCANLKKKKKKV